MNKREYSSNESDEDYLPEGADTDPPSEEESDGEPEENIVADDSNKKRGRKRAKRKSRKDKKLKTNDSEESDNSEETEKKPLNEEEEKKKADSLWADFMKDTGLKPKPKQDETSGKKSPASTNISKERITVTKVFEFAGEEVRVNKEIPIDSAEARICAPTTNASTVSTSRKAIERGRPRGRGLAGISSVLNQIGRKQKISTLEKSKLDWDQFKKEEDIEEELQSYNKGKNGYLERQDFLERADLRQFEKEKEIRTTLRSHRL